MKPTKSISLHKKNQRSLTIEVNRQPKPRLHQSNPKPRTQNHKLSILNNTYKQLTLSKQHISKNSIRLKTDINATIGLPCYNNNSFAELKNHSLASMICKRQPSLRKDSCPKLKQKKQQRQRLSIDVYVKSPEHKSILNSTKSISRRRSTLISKMKTQVSQQLISHQIVFPQAAKEVIKSMGQYLSQRQIDEISQVQMVYCVNKKERSYMGQENHGYDDKKGFYITQIGDQVGYRFQIIEKLGKGSFGQVVQVYDHKKKQSCALKIIRNRKTPNSQALIEYGILRTLNSNGSQSQNIVKVYEAFRFRNHFCMTFQLLSLNLYDLLKSHKFTPFSSQLIRRLAIQILSALIYLRRKNIVHCDIKPQNVLLKQIDKSGIKLIDFGSSCYSDERMYSYIQSRYYRAPEVILGYEYSFPIDMWSFGCVVAELRLTYPLFGGEDQKQQVGLIAQVIGLPEKKFYSKTERGQLYFQKNQLKDRQGQIITPGARPLKDLFEDNDFIEFLQKIFVWQPHKRIGPIDALRHPWILKGIPQDIRAQHLQYLNQQQSILHGIREKGQSSTLSQQILSKNHH